MKRKLALANSYFCLKTKSFDYISVPLLVAVVVGLNLHFHLLQRRAGAHFCDYITFYFIFLFGYLIL